MGFSQSRPRENKANIGGYSNQVLENLTRHHLGITIVKPARLKAPRISGIAVFSMMLAFAGWAGQTSLRGNNLVDYGPVEWGFEEFRSGRSELSGSAFTQSKAWPQDRNGWHLCESRKPIHDAREYSQSL
jgi:hypothetical protein